MTQNTRPDLSRPETKEQYFYLHYGQPVFKIEMLSTLHSKPHAEILDDDYLVLTSLASITDKDLVKFYHLHSAIIGYDYTQDFAPTIVMAKHWINNDGLKVFSKYGALRDFARSLGYAVDWMGYTVKELIEAGYCQLRKDNNNG